MAAETYVVLRSRYFARHITNKESIRASTGIKYWSGALGRVFCTFFVLLGIVSLGTTSAVIAADHDIAADESPAKAGPYIVGGIGLVNYNISHQVCKNSTQAY